MGGWALTTENRNVLSSHLHVRTSVLVIRCWCHRGRAHIFLAKEAVRKDLGLEVLVKGERF